MRANHVFIESVAGIKSAVFPMPRVLRNPPNRLLTPLISKTPLNFPAFVCMVDVKLRLFA